MNAAEKRKWGEILALSNGEEDIAADVYIRWKCTTDLYFLATEILGLSKAREGKRKRWDPVFHRWMAKKMEQEKDTLLLVPRGHMKSTLAKIRVIQMVLKNPMIRIALISRTAGLVEEQLTDIKRMIATPLLRRYFPELIPDPGPKFKNWQKATLNELTTVRKSEWGRVPQENMIEAWGMGATITGRHYDVIILDDVLNEDSISTPEQITKVKDYYSYLQAIKEPGGFELIVGTRYHYSDLYGHIIRNRWFGPRVYSREAIEGGRPIYKFFTLSMLMTIKRRVGPYIWSCQYENNPVPKELQIFIPPFPQFKYLPGGEWEYYMTVDPAATQKTYSDYTGFVVVAVNDAGKMYVLEAIQLKLKSEEVAAMILKLANKYRPRRVGIEFGLQTALQYVLDTKRLEWERENGEELTMPVVPIKIPRHISKEARIERTLGSFVRDGRLLLRDDLEDLMKQMEHFPRGEHDDLIDALSMSFQVIERFRGMYWDEQVQAPDRGKTFFDYFGRQKTGAGSWEEKFVS